MEARAVLELYEGVTGLATDVEHERMGISLPVVGGGPQSLSFFNLVLVVYYY
jgi:hypothetical protein